MHCRSVDIGRSEHINVIERIADFDRGSRTWQSSDKGKALVSNCLYQVSDPLASLKVNLTDNLFRLFRIYLLSRRNLQATASCQQQQPLRRSNPLFAILRHHSASESASRLTSGVNLFPRRHLEQFSSARCPISSLSSVQLPSSKGLRTRAIPVHVNKRFATAWYLHSQRRTVLLLVNLMKPGFLFICIHWHC